MRVLFTTAYGYWGAWNPSDLDDPGCLTMIAGGEQAMIRLSQHLARKGHEVIVFYDVRKSGRYDGVDYLPKDMAIPMLMNMDHDIHISFECVPTIEIASRSKVVIYAMQCNTMDIRSRDILVDRYQCVSRWHAGTVYATDPTVSSHKFLLIPNGWYGPDFFGYVDRVPNRIIYASSPDRGLHHLLRMWPRILERIPDAELVVLYDFDRWYNLIVEKDGDGWHLHTADLAYEVKRLFDEVRHRNVVHTGAVGHRSAINEIRKASLLVYPCEPVQPTEGFSCTVLEGLVAGTPVITSNADAFPELWSEAVARMLPLPIDDNQWIDAITTLLRDKVEWDFASKRGCNYAQDYRWDLIGDQYEQVLLGILESKIEGRLHEQQGSSQGYID
uniref:Putative glycosyltransferase n=1 Tax=viral metagenome TaxID=1070528 RepID=A0A6M3KI03_9ZZZZ